MRLGQTGNIGLQASDLATIGHPLQIIDRRERHQLHQAATQPEGLRLGDGSIEPAQLCHRNVGVEQ